MIHYLIIIIVAVAVFSLVTSPAFATTGDTLSIFTSHKSIPEGETFVLSGKLKDRNLNPIRNAEIIIWESDRTANSHVGVTTTNSNGEYQIVVTAKYWDGIGNAVEIFAFAGGVVSVKSPEITINIEKPNSYNSGSSSIGTSNPSIGTYFNTKLSLQIIDGSSQGYIKVKPTLTYSSGNKLSNYDISIFVDKEHKGIVKSDQWSSNIYTRQPGHHTIEAYFLETTSNFDSSVRYRASSDSELYFVKAATTSIGSTSTPSSSSSSGVASSDIFPIEYVIVGVALTAAAAGVGIALSKRKKAAPMLYASPANIPVPATDDTQFWVCPNCGKDTQYKNGKQYCDSCKVYL